MLFWEIIISAIVFLVLLIIPFRSRWYMGCGFGLAGAILAGGIAFGACWYYLKYYYVKPRPRNDSDWAGLETLVLCLLVIVGSTVLGLLGGIGCAYGLGLARSSSDKPSSIPDPLEF